MRLDTQRLTEKTSLVLCLVYLIFGIGNLDSATEAQEASDALRAESLADRVQIFCGKQLVTEYVFEDQQILRPYFSNLRTPSGVQVTRNHPPIKGKDQEDHATMHPGVWLGFGKFNGVDFWRNKGTIKHTVFSRSPTVTDGTVEFGTQSNFVDEAGTTLGKLDCFYQIHKVDHGFMLVVVCDIYSDDRAIELGDQEEMGFGVRVATQCTEKNGGKIRSSTGAESAKATWGKSASWCDYSGVSDNSKIGVTAMCASNSPTWWHNRDYGLMVANQFGRGAMKQGEPLTTRFEPGQKLRLNFGVVVHEGEDYSAETQYKEFAELVKSFAASRN